MSVVVGETPSGEARDSALVAEDDAELAAALPLSLTLWIYLDVLPDVWTLFWYGESGATDNIARCAGRRAPAGSSASGGRGGDDMAGAVMHKHQDEQLEAPGAADAIERGWDAFRADCKQYDRVFLEEGASS